MLLVSDANSSHSKEARFLMLTWEDDLEVHALRKRGWSISAIARHTGHDGPSSLSGQGLVRVSACR